MKGNYCFELLDLFLDEADNSNGIETSEGEDNNNY